jgi:hypothetical protein
MKHLTHDWYTLLTRRAASRSGGKLFWLGLGIFVLVLNLYAPAEPTSIERVLASSIILLAFGTIWFWTYRGGGCAEIGFLPVFVIVYSLEFALPIFTLKVYAMDPFNERSVSDWALEKALLLALVGLFSIIVGYYWPGHRRVARALPKVRLPWRNKAAVQFVSLCFAGLGLFVFLITFTLTFPPEVQAYLNLPSEFFYLSIVVLLILQMEGELTFGYAVLLWGFLVPLRALISLAQGLLGSAIIEAAALLITYTTLRRRIPWAIFIAGFATFFFLQPIKGSMRAMVFAGGWINREQDQGAKFSALATAGAAGVVALQNLDPTDLLAIATSRLASIMILGTVVEVTPQDVPYWGGTTYYPLLFMTVPRLVYPDKPSDLPGNVFGHKYGMLAPENYSTSINLIQELELYGNFGPLGVIFGSILIGMLYRSINDSCLSEGCGLGALVGGIYIFMHLADIENSASSIFGSLLIQAIAVMIFHYGVRFSEPLFVAAGARFSGQPSLQPELASIESGRGRPYP